MTFKLKEGINKCTNAQYHGDKDWLSSSSLKTLLRDSLAFEKEYILKEPVERKHIAAFDEGTYAHSLLLEPESVDEEFRFFDGWRKQGKEWEAFKAKDDGRIVLSKPQKKRVESWVESAKELKAAMDLLKNGEPEYTVAKELKGVKLKARADYINLEAGYIVDVKTTSSDTDVISFKETMDSFEYALSAALYSMLFELEYGKKFDFYFIVLGKRSKATDVYKMSKETMTEGRIKVLKSLELYKKGVETGNWDFTGSSSNDNMETEDYLIQEV